MSAGTEERSWTVGELADELGVTTRTLRHYEAEGLLLPARHGSQRVYGVRDRARLRLILRGRRFGMSLAECREIVDMYDGAGSSEVRQLTALLGRLDQIGADLRRRQADLQGTLEEMGEVANQCRARLRQLASDGRPASNLDDHRTSNPDDRPEREAADRSAREPGDRRASDRDGRPRPGPGRTPARPAADQPTPASTDAN